MEDNKNTVCTEEATEKKSWLKKINWKNAGKTALKVAAGVLLGFGLGKVVSKTSGNDDNYQLTEASNNQIVLSEDEFEVK